MQSRQNKEKINRMKKTISKQKAFLLYSVIALILILAITLNITAYNFAGVITRYLCGFGFDFDSEAAIAARQEGNALVQNIDREGFVLLKNKEKALPLEADGDGEYKVNVFGWSGSDSGFYHKGYGSGGGSNNNVISLYAGLEQGGLKVNPALAKAYNDIKLKNGRYSGYTVEPQARYQVYEPGGAFLSANLAQAKSWSDTALVVISRVGSEGTDLPRVQYSADDWSVLDNGRTYLQLSPDEEELVNFCKINFDKTVILLNTSNVMECGFIDDPAIDAALWIGLPGNAGTPVIGEVLRGEITPSGHLVDTYPYDLKDDPAYVNSGMDGIGKYQRTAAGGNYVDYAEGIYTGYFWYETASAEGFFDARGGYDKVVQYPFGYGMSYTDFSWELVSVDKANGGTLAANATVEFKIAVENIGEEYAGRDVVQLYVHAPYKLGEIEKPEVKLVGFAKTALLKPDDVQELTISVRLADLASYDCYDANNNGFMGYELDGGNYEFSFRTDSHRIKDMHGDEKFSFAVPQGGYKYENDPDTGYKVENRFTTYTNGISGASSVVDESKVTTAKMFSVDGDDCGQNVVYMTRADFAGTFPKKLGNRAMSAVLAENAVTFPSPLKNPSDEKPTTGSKATQWKLTDLAGLPITHERWNELISQLDVSTLIKLCNDGGYQTMAIEEIGKPECIDMDGGSGIYPAIIGFDVGAAVTYPCATLIAATWNWYLAYETGGSLAKEALAIGMNGWYAPNANMHRSPWGGRNFEYFSEDPLVAGTMCANEARGSIQGGVYVYVKHFVANDSDQGRNAEYRWLTEQALREIYCRPFELAVKKGGANAIMTSVDRIGATRAASSYGLLTEVLRNEWGFCGSVITDYYQGGNCHDADQNIRAGNDLQLWPNGTVQFDDTSSNTAIKALQNSAKNILYTYIDTQYIHATEAKLELADIIGTRNAVFPWWVIILVALDAIIAAGCAVWAVFIAKKTKRETDDGVNGAEKEN